MEHASATLDSFSTYLATSTLVVLGFLTAWLKMFWHICFFYISRQVFSCFTKFLWLKKSCLLHMNMHLWIFTERQGLTYIHLKRVRKEKIQKKQGVLKQTKLRYHSGWSSLIWIRNYLWVSVYKFYSLDRLSRTSFLFFWRRWRHKHNIYEQINVLKMKAPKIMFTLDIEEDFALKVVRV